MLWFSSKPNISSSCVQPNLKELNKNGAIDLELNILCVLLCPFAFIFHENACLQRNALACIYESSEEAKKADFGRESQAQSQRSHFIVNLFFFLANYFTLQGLRFLNEKEGNRKANRQTQSHVITR